MRAGAARVCIVPEAAGSAACRRVLDGVFSSSGCSVVLSECAEVAEVLFFDELLRGGPRLFDSGVWQR